MTDRILPLTGVHNFRDFGGYASRHGGQVKRGKLYRSGHYAEATPQDISQLEALGIHVQADLRRPDERERQAGRWAARKTITNDDGREQESPHVQFLRQVEVDASQADDWMNDYYAKAPFKAHHQALFRDWFVHLPEVEEGGAALVNCAAGKDRTGILCALTHFVLGVSEQDIKADYELTNKAVDIDARLPDATRFFNDMLGKDYAPDVYRPFMGVRGRYLDTAISVITDRHGSIDAYLADALGVGPGQQDRLRLLLLES